MRAEGYFKQAIALDAGFAGPHAQLAFCCAANTLNGRLPAAEAVARGRAEVARALELGERLADAHAALAHIQHRTEYDWVDAERSFKYALALSPSHAEGLARYDELLYASGRVEEGPSTPIPAFRISSAASD